MTPQCGQYSTLAANRPAAANASVPRTEPVVSQNDQLSVLHIRVQICWHLGLPYGVRYLFCKDTSYYILEFSCLHKIITCTQKKMILCTQEKKKEKQIGGTSGAPWRINDFSLHLNGTVVVFHTKTASHSLASNAWRHCNKRKENYIIIE